MEWICLVIVVMSETKSQWSMLSLSIGNDVIRNILWIAFNTQRSSHRNKSLAVTNSDKFPNLKIDRKEKRYTLLVKKISYFSIVDLYLILFSSAYFVGLVEGCVGLRNRSARVITHRNFTTLQRHNWLVCWYRNACKSIVNTITENMNSPSDNLLLMHWMWQLDSRLVIFSYLN